MRTVTAALILALGAGCSTVPSPQLAKFISPRPPKIEAPVPAPVESGTVDILGVHGEVQYWDGHEWCALRPNMVLSNTVQLRPGADSCVNLRHDHCVTVRLRADHQLHVEALVVRHFRGTTLPSTGADADGSAAICTACQIEASGFLGRQTGAEFALCSDGKVETVKGFVRVSGAGQTVAMSGGDAVALAADEFRKVSFKEPAPADGAWLEVTVPRSETSPFDTASVWQTSPRLGD